MPFMYMCIKLVNLVYMCTYMHMYVYMKVQKGYPILNLGGGKPSALLRSNLNMQIMSTNSTLTWYKCRLTCKSSKCTHVCTICVYMTQFTHCVYGTSTCTCTCWLLRSNQRFCRQIAGYRRGVGDHCERGSWANKIVARP